MPPELPGQARGTTGEGLERRERGERGQWDEGGGMEKGRTGGQGGGRLEKLPEVH